MSERFSKLKKWRREALSIWDDSALRSGRPLTRLHRFAHFWVLVWKSFSRNRCPVRASALAYVSLLSLIPMLAVIMSVTSTFLKKEGEEEIDAFIVKFVSSVIPPATVGGTNTPPESAAEPDTNAPTAGATNALASAATNASGSGDANVPAAGATNALSSSATNGNTAATTAAPGKGLTQTNETTIASLAEDKRAIVVRKMAARHIHDFIQNTRSGALGISGSVVLIFAAISMLSRIEDTFNDIWGVARGRNWFTRIVLYWGVITLAPLLLAVVIGLSSTPHLQATRRFVTQMPFVGSLIFQVLPIVVVCATFALFYILIPNTKVRWQAAAAGGVVGGLLFHLNNLVSVLYVSRVVTNSKIYGSLALVPVFMVGLYFSWLILLFGAQVAYAFQNRVAYLEERQMENINQRGREFIALRLMTFIGQRFLAGEHPRPVAEMGQDLCVPSRLIQHVMQTLLQARLVVEASGTDAAYMPARPLEQISVHDVLMAMRATHGQQLSITDEPVRNEVYGEFTRIEEAERAAASSVTILGLAHRARAKQLPAGGASGNP
jgi:membrane protein